jgi:molybdopterin-guanine dinucleotide biosynthesis protein A
MSPPPTVGAATAIVLAGGRSSRFGSDKLVATVDGAPLIHHPIRAVAAVVERIVVVAAPGAALPLPAELVDRIEVVHDAEPFGGPLLGLGAALATVETPIAIVVAGDMPSLAPPVLARLLAALGPARAAMLEVPGRLQPLPSAVEVSSARSAIAEALGRGERSLAALLSRLDAALVPQAVWLALDPAGASITDIDRPEDVPGR